MISDLKRIEIAPLLRIIEIDCLRSYHTKVHDFESEMILTACQPCGIIISVVYPTTTCSLVYSYFSSCVCIYIAWDIYRTHRLLLSLASCVDVCKMYKTNTIFRVCQFACNLSVRWKCEHRGIFFPFGM